MTVVPLPASPCIRVKLDYTTDSGNDAGSRFYVSYTGSAPTVAYLNTLCSDIAGFWTTDLAPLTQVSNTLVDVDAQDIATEIGASGHWSGSEAGGDSSAALPINAAVNIEFDIARRYRGGKPRMFLPPPGQNKLNTSAAWTTTYIDDVNTGIAAFFAAIAALSIGSLGTLAHVNLSYYKGFTNIMNSSGRERAVPTYRAAALVDPVTGYATKAIVGSQRRRRTATTF
jgi:hypothetical protein